MFKRCMAEVSRVGWILGSNHGALTKRETKMNVFAQSCKIIITAEFKGYAMSIFSCSELWQILSKNKHMSNIPNHTITIQIYFSIDNIHFGMGKDNSQWGIITYNNNGMYRMRSCACMFVMKM